MMVMAAFLQTIPTKCDRCGDMVEFFFDRSSWWRRYLQPGEERVCKPCMIATAGFIADRVPPDAEPGMPTLEKIGQRDEIVPDEI